MHITTVDIDNHQPPSFRIHRVHGRNDYLFVLFKSPAKVLIHDQYVDVDKGCCVLFGRHMIQSYHPANGTEFFHDFIHFSPDLEYEHMLLDEIPCNEVIEVFLPNQISEILLAIKKEAGNSFSRYKKDILTSYGNVFLHRLVNELHHSRNHEKRQNFRLLYDLRREIYRHPELDWSIDNICKRVSLSRSYLQHMYKEFFDVSCNADVAVARVSAAKAMLISTQLQISQVAERCGYNTTEHFIRQFKKLVGVTPNVFRNE